MPTKWYVEDLLRVNILGSVPTPHVSLLVLIEKV